MDQLRNYVLTEYKTVFDEDTSQNLEKSTYTHAIHRFKTNNDNSDNLDNVEFKNVYKQIYMKIISNVKLNKNKDYVLAQIKENKINVEDLPLLSREILYPEKWENLYVQRTDNLKRRKVKGMHKCPKCKSWYTVHQEMQTRSCDESSTVHITCLDCNYNFKYS